MVRFTNEILNKLINAQNEEYVVAGDTDSCVGSTIVNINKESFEELFKKYENKVQKHIQANGTERLDIQDENEYSYSANGMSLIKSISRHKVSKGRWKISVGKNQVETTEDHSIMVYRNRRSD